jgi:hypothetical protein
MYKYILVSFKKGNTKNQAKNSIRVQVQKHGLTRKQPTIASVLAHTSSLSSLSSPTNSSFLHSCCLNILDSFHYLLLSIFDVPLLKLIAIFDVGTVMKVHWFQANNISVNMTSPRSWISHTEIDFRMAARNNSHVYSHLFSC